MTGRTIMAANKSATKNNLKTSNPNPATKTQGTFKAKTLNLAQAREIRSKKISFVIVATKLF